MPTIKTEDTKAEIERLEKALKDCADSGIRHRGLRSVGDTPGQLPRFGLCQHRGRGQERRQEGGQRQ